MNREVAVILALGALALAALFVSIGSFVLLWADRRDRSGGPGGVAGPERDSDEESSQRTPRTEGARANSARDPASPPVAEPPASEG